MAGSIPATVKEKLQGLADAYTAFKEGLDPRQQRLFRILVFLARFAVLAAPFYLLLGSGWDASGIRHLTADVSATLLRLLGVEASSSGTAVTTAEMLVEVTRDSTGWKSVVAFTALVAASHRDWASKVKGMLAGSLLILAVNLLRITSMVYAVTVFGVNYELLHTVLWRWGLTAAVIAAWASWMFFSAPSPGFNVLDRR